MTMAKVMQSRAVPGVILSPPTGVPRAHPTSRMNVNLHSLRRPLSPSGSALPYQMKTSPLPAPLHKPATPWATVSIRICVKAYPPFGPFRSVHDIKIHSSNAYPSQLHARYASPVMHDLDCTNLQTPEKIHIRELLHFFHISGLGNFLVVVKNPRWGLIVG
jgi:hypothetical protein